jgi:putative oxidoreductase
MTAAAVNAREQLAASLLRIALGAMYVTHGLVLKVWTYGFAGTAGYFESIGLPGPLAYVVIVAEVAGGVLLIANVAPGFVAAALVPVLVGATWAHAGNGWVFSNEGGGWEYPAFLVVVSLAVALQHGLAPVRRAKHAAPALEGG